MARFTDQADRQAPVRADFVEIFNRQLLGVSDGLTIVGLKERISLLGSCECGCKRPFEGSAEWQHKPPLWKVRKGEKQRFEAWRSDCHAVDSKSQNTLAAKTKRQAGLTGQYKRRKERKANGKPPLLQGGGFKSAPEGYSAWGKGRGFPKKGEFKSNVRQDG